MIAKRNNSARGIVPTIDPPEPPAGGCRAPASFHIHLPAGRSLPHAELRFQRRCGLRLLEFGRSGETDVEKAHASRFVTWRG